MVTQWNLNLRNITQLEFATLGMHDVAYIKPKVIDGYISYAICTADGKEVAVEETRDVAFATVRQHDLEPLSVH